MANTKNVEDKLGRKKIKRTARKKAAPKAARTTPRGSNEKKAKKLTRGQSKREVFGCAGWQGAENSEWGEKNVPWWIKPDVFWSFTARLRSCPDTKQTSFRGL